MAIKAVVRVLVYSVAIFLVLAYVPGLLDVEPAYIELSSPRPFIGPLQRNTKLENAEKLLADLIHGPESLAFYEGHLYTGLHNGWIIRLKNDRSMEPIVRVSNNQCGSWEEETCGRPLGLRFDKNGKLNVADGYQGLYSVDINTGYIKHIFHSSQPVDGKRPLIINDFDMSSTGDIYFSDSSTKFLLKDGIYEILESAPNGRILHHALKSNVTRTLIDNIAFANGVQLSPDEDYLLYCESTRNRVMKYHLKGPNKGKLAVFIDNLPGVPDNIRSNGHGGYWLALCSANPPEFLSMLKVLGPHHLVRKVLARLIYLTKSVFQVIDRLIPLSATKTLIYKLGHMTSYTSWEPQYGLILEIDNNGEIIRSLHAPSGSVTFISEVAQIGNALYLGSPWNRYIAKVTI